MIFELGVFAVFNLILLIPIARIVSKAGYSGWLSLIWFLPLVNLVMLWVFAFSRWPAFRSNAADHFS